MARSSLLMPATQTRQFEGWEAFQSVKFPRRIINFHGGKRLADIRLQEIKLDSGMRSPKPSPKSLFPTLRHFRLETLRPDGEIFLADASHPDPTIRGMGGVSECKVSTADYQFPWRKEAGRYKGNQRLLYGQECDRIQCDLGFIRSVILC